MEEFINEYLGFKMILEKIEDDSKFTHEKDMIGRYNVIICGSCFESNKTFKMKNNAIDYIKDMMNCKTKNETRECSYKWSKNKL